MAKMPQNWLAPDEWDRIFTAAILEVAKDLKIDVVGELNSGQNCLFTRIPTGTWYNFRVNENVVISGRYRKESYGNININGLDYHPEIDKEIVLKTCVGVNRHWFNEWLFPLLYDKNAMTLTKKGAVVEDFCAAYDGDITFARKNLAES